ncbi:DUF2057 domain-containing protein [Shewanella sp. A25]|nr:DUF2057 domain-containing protein [Shewanella shenzhenensis]
MKTSLLSNTLIGFTLAVGTLLSSVTANAATINDTETLRLVSINGQASKSLSNVQLPDGKVLIEVKYQDLFNYRADDSGVWVKSEPLFFTLEIPAASTANYQITKPTLTNEAEARRFIQAPTIELKIDGANNLTLPLETHSQLMADMLEEHASR